MFGVMFKKSWLRAGGKLVKSSILKTRKRRLSSYVQSLKLTLSSFYYLYWKLGSGRQTWFSINKLLQSVYWLTLIHICAFDYSNLVYLTVGTGGLLDFVGDFLNYWFYKFLCQRWQYKLFWQQCRRRLKRKSLKLRYASKKALRYRWRFTKCLTRKKKRYYIIMKYRTKSFRSKMFRRVQGRMESGYAYGFSSTITGRSFVLSERVNLRIKPLVGLNLDICVFLVNGRDLNGSVNT